MLNFQHFGIYVISDSSAQSPDSVKQMFAHLISGVTIRRF